MFNENGTKKEMKNILTPGCRTTYLQSVSFHEIKQWCDDITLEFSSTESVRRADGRKNKVK